MKPLYQFNLPVTTNDGASYDWAIQAWHRDAMRLAGGLTQLPECQGAWEHDGRVYFDRISPVQIMCDAEIKDKLVERAQHYFNDQLAIFVAQIGVAEIIER